MNILLVFSVLLGFGAVALTGYVVSSGAWILALLIAGFSFSTVFLFYWRSQKRQFAACVGLLFLLICVACVGLGKAFDDDAITNTQLVIASIKRFERRVGRLPSATLDLKSQDLGGWIDRTYLSPGHRFWVTKNVEGTDACVIREAFPFGKRIRCSKSDTEHEVYD